MTPYRFWLKTIQEQYRVRIGGEIAEVVPWLKAEKGFKATCGGFIGAAGQFQIAIRSLGSEVVASLEASLRATPAHAEESSSSWARFARFTSMTWELTCSFEEGTGRFSLVLPKEPRDLGILPESGQIVVFAAGAVVELWKPAEWLEHGRAAHSDIKTLITETTNELKARG